MSPQQTTMRKNSSNEHGIVLVAIIVIIMVMTILAIGVMSMNVSQSLSNQRQIDRIKAELLAHGIFWEEYMKITFDDSPLPAGGNRTDTASLDHKDFEHSISRDPADTSYTITITWPQ